MDASDRRRRASEEAAAWWVRLQSEAPDRAEREEFVDWLRESAVHVAEMLRVAKVHDALERFQGWAEIADGPDDHGDGDNVVSLPPYSRSAEDQDRSGVSSPDWQIRTSAQASPESSRRRLWVGAIAAGFAAIAVLGALLFPVLRGQTIQTERGERREVALADGSVVEVDPQTRLRVEFEEHTRRIILERGRAMFRVAKNPARPFLVQADGTTVRAVGTAFGVEHGEQGVIVTVQEGKVGVYSSDAPARLGVKQASTPDGTASPSTVTMQRPPSREVLLTAGQQVRMPSSGAAEPVRDVNSDRELAWAKGQLVFDNQSVANAVEEFNRYNRVQLHVRNAALAMRPVSGVFDASDPESFIGFLQTVASVQVTRNDSEIIMQ
jgi:transmembrane sensor